MSFKEQKTIKIILEECGKVEERCEGYKKELVNLVTDIIEEEKIHKVQHTHIQQKINDKLEVSGHFLAERKEGKT